MSFLQKRNSRSPKITDGYAYFGCDWVMNEPVTADGTPPVRYKVTIGNRNPTGAAQHVAEEHEVGLTEEQMLEAVHEWMKLFARNRAEERKRQRAKS